MKIGATYGSWKSPITSELIVAGAVRLGAPKFNGDDLYWIEGRPNEGGRNVIVRRTADGAIEDLLPAPFNARTRVHEYGGGSMAVHAGSVIFSNFSDQRLYHLRPGGAPEALTPASDLRYADMTVDATRGLLFCVREDHRAPHKEAQNTLVRLMLAGDPEGGTGVAEGYDFYASPRLNLDGNQLAWLCWNHPNMPWDGCELWLADVQPNGDLANAHHVAGGLEESIFQPTWGPDGQLYFVSDRTGWWNLYRLEDGNARALLPMKAEFGLPQWVFGQITFIFTDPQTLICIYSQNGQDHLGKLNLQTLNFTTLDVPFSNLALPAVGTAGIALLTSSPTESTALRLLDPANGSSTVIRRSSDLQLNPGYLSIPEAITFPTSNGLTAHALFYRPKNRDFTAPEGARPPLLVFSHGGPTGATSSVLNLSIQYWTSRGFAVLDVNYGGSTGYGRAYRQRLNGNWGIVDVEDCINGARYLVERGEVDEAHLAIRGGSAGGYTTLCALTFHKVFAAGASHYGIGDIEALARDTHKFESRYLDRLVGPYPERIDLYQARSPIHFTDQLSCPVIFFQGLDDPVVPPNQAEAMVAALKEKGIPVAYVPFEGEQHGFRRAENIRRALDSELYFYSRVFAFELAEPVEPVLIENLT
ncbi:MAG: S9 family peptidase [Anaerolineae bacterium]|nr:S9 family peptidase [Anaerolineae bacterium]